MINRVFIFTIFFKSKRTMGQNANESYVCYATTQVINKFAKFCLISWGRF